MNIVVQITRILTGVLFIFSGLIKLNDPVGFSFKLEEYFVVFGTEFMVPLALTLAVFLCVFEVVTGLALILGVYRRWTMWGLLLMIIFFTFLTFYSAYFNKVTDCGCFGDAIPLTPWQSFTKDVILSVAILFLFIRQKAIKPALSLATARNYFDRGNRTPGIPGILGDPSPATYGFPCLQDRNGHRAGYGSSRGRTDR